MANVQQHNKEFFCTYDDCHKTFSSISHLQRHEDTHIDINYDCKECCVVFRSQYALKRHEDNIHLKKTPKKYKCDYCEEDFNKKTWLNRHIFEHNGIKPYKCTFKDCDASFLVPSKLRRHLLIHEGYTCPKENCKEKFAKWTEVRKHLKLAHPKVFKCPECEREFSRSNNLKSHLVIHKLDRHVFLCPKEGCDKFYSKNSNLLHHISSYHEKRPFHCTFGLCCRSFKSQEELDDHVSKHRPPARLKKRKKKKKPEPSFAEKLAGLAPKKWQIDVLKGTFKSTDDKSTVKSFSDAASFDDVGEQQENVTETQEVLLSTEFDENCDIACDFISDEDRNNNESNFTVNDDNSNCVQNDDIHALLNIIEKRKNQVSESDEAKCISIEA